MVDVVAVPHRLEDGVGEAEDHDVLDGLFAQVVIDAIDLAFVEDLVDLRVERLRAGQIVAERLLDDDAYVAVGLSTVRVRRAQVAATMGG